MKTVAFLICLATIIIAGLTGCAKKESFSDIPEIGYLDFINVYDTSRYAIKGILSISFQDGNGDIGLDNRRDTLYPYQKNGPYYYNMVITYFEKQKGIFKQVDLEIPFSARIPPLVPGNINKAIKGTITDTLILNPNPVYDTIQFGVFIYDHALNKSNVITTPEIIVRKH
jgi:hypothetical protein